MKLFTLAQDDNGKLDIRSDMSLDSVKQRIDALMVQAGIEQGIEQGKIMERQRIRQGYKKRREKANGKSS